MTLALHGVPDQPTLEQKRERGCSSPSRFELFGRQEDLAAEEAMPAAPGNLLAHHALTIHRAGGNLSATRSRRALGFIF